MASKLSLNKYLSSANPEWFPPGIAVLVHLSLQSVVFQTLAYQNHQLTHGYLANLRAESLHSRRDLNSVLAVWKGDLELRSRTSKNKNSRASPFHRPWKNRCPGVRSPDSNRPAFKPEPPLSPSS